MINNRQPGRRRGRGGNPGSGGNNGGGGQRQGNPGRGDSGSRIDNRARGNASQLYEKYKNLASDAQRQGDRVNIEYYLQFADHYFRVLSEQRGPVAEQQPRRQRDDFEFEGDEEFGDEGDTVRAGEQGRVGEQGEVPRFDRDERPRENYRGEQRDGQQREANARDGNQRDAGQREGHQQRETGQRGDQARAELPRSEQRSFGAQRGEQGGEQQGGQRSDEQRPARGEWQERDRQPRGGESQPIEIAGQRRADPIIASESLENRAEEVLEADRPLDAPAPRRRGRPRREQAETPVSVDTGDGEPLGLPADLLPPSLTVAANDEAPAEVKPRRRRVRAVETPNAAE